MLALITKSEANTDWHWEREWRIVGDFDFNLNKVYCGLCPESEIQAFEEKYEIKFLDPNWGINKILDKLVGNKK